MILLNKFINPTRATGKILQEYWRDLKSVTLNCVNVRGLYLHAFDSEYNLFTYPVSDKLGMIPIKKRTYTHFENGPCRFTRIIYKNNKKVEISNNTCALCFSKTTRLMIGKNTLFEGMRKHNPYCADCKFFKSFRVKNLFKTAMVIKDYTQYYNA